MGCGGFRFASTHPTWLLASLGGVGGATGRAAVIRFPPPPRPAGFAEQVEVPGARWLAGHPDAKRPKDLWSPFRGHLALGFRHLCAYSALYEPVGSVDHFISCTEDRNRAYDWGNYRYAAQWINASKRDLRAAQLLAR